MDNNKGSSNIKDDIVNIVQSAIDTKDFAKLNTDITETVNHALEELRYQLRYKAPNEQPVNRTPVKEVQQTSGAIEEVRTQQHTQTAPASAPRSNVHIGFMSSQTIAYKPPVRTGTSVKTTQTAPAVYQNTQNNNMKVFVPHHQVGSIKGSVYYALGVTFSALTGLGAFVLAILAAAIPMNYALGAIASSLFASLPIWLIMAARGSHLRKRTHRLNNYVSRLGVKGFATIQELARSVGHSSRYVIKDLQKMLSLGVFPEGHFDQNYTCFIATNASYEQYRLAQDNYNNSIKDDTPNTAETVIDESKTKNDRLNAVIKQGNEYIRKIREINDELPDEDISAKLDTLETTIDKIFQQVDRHPEQLPELDKFMQYYLPTTIKLLTVYCDFDKQPIQGENINTAKKEILGTLDTINQAFIKLFDSLFQATAWDVSTDISVLETMLAQEGLTQSAFEMKGEQ